MYHYIFIALNNFVEVIDNWAASAKVNGYGKITSSTLGHCRLTDIDKNLLELTNYS